MLLTNILPVLEQKLCSLPASYRFLKLLLALLGFEARADKPSKTSKML
jgi:hypothetical protein